MKIIGGRAMYVTWLDISRAVYAYQCGDFLNLLDNTPEAKLLARSFITWPTR